MRKELCDQLRVKAKAASDLESLTQRGSDKRVEWGDIDSEEAQRDPVLDLVIPSFESLFPDDGEDEDEGPTICLGYDIAGIPSKTTLCALLHGALDEEEPLEGPQFYIKSSPVLHQAGHEGTFRRGSDVRRNAGHRSRDKGRL